MKTKVDDQLERGRVIRGPLATTVNDGLCGLFVLKSPIDRKPLVVLSWPAGLTDDVTAKWDHVAVARKSRTPNWPEMCFVKSLFFDYTETVVQFHPAQSDAIGDKGGLSRSLHLWRNIQGHELPVKMFDGSLSKMVDAMKVHG